MNELINPRTMALLALILLTTEIISLGHLSFVLGSLAVSIVVTQFAVLFGFIPKEIVWFCATALFLWCGIFAVSFHALIKFQKKKAQ